MLRVFIIVICAMQTLNCMAQPCTVKGRVTAFITGEALAGASVMSIKNDQQGTMTNPNGDFELSLAPDDTLLVTYIGFESVRIPAPAIYNCSLSVALKPIEEMMKGVEIKAERIIAEEFTIHKIKKLDIYTNPSAKADPLLAVNSTPSATPLDESANISLRGGSPAETGIFLNNVPINDAVRYSQLNGIGTFSIFNTALINNIKVYPGNPPLEYGSSTSGLIALQTDENIPETPMNTVSLTLANIGVYTSRKLTERSSLTLFSNYQPSRFIRSLNKRSLKDLKAFSSADVGFHYFRKLKSNAIVKLFNYSLHESYKFNYEQPTYSGIFHQLKTRNFTVGNFRKRIGKTELSFNQGISFSTADYNYGTTDIDLNLHDLFSSMNIHHTGMLSEWKTGISYDRKSSDFSGTFPAFDFATGEGHPVIDASSHAHVTNPEWYGYYKHYLAPGWITGIGLRKNIAIESTESYFSVQGNLHYDHDEKWNINAAAGQYHKYQLPQGESNAPFLITSTQYSVDINFSIPKAESSLAVFYKTSTGASTETRVTGVEFFTKYRLSKALRFQVSFTGLDAVEIREKITRPSPYNIHYFVRGNIEYKIKGTWTITTVFLFRQGSYFYPVTQILYNDRLKVYEPFYDSAGERLPAYNTIDISVSKIFPFTEKSVAIAFLSTGNVANWKNVRTFTYNFDYSTRKANLFSQRTFYFGLIINF